MQTQLPPGPCACAKTYARTHTQARAHVRLFAYSLPVCDTESYEAFGYVNDVPGFSFADKLANQWLGATAMWLAQGKIKKKYGIEDERKALHACVAKWTDAVGPNDFLGGAGPNLADLCVFGVGRFMCLLCDAAPPRPVPSSK